jgi:hypothetical protein
VYKGIGFERRSKTLLYFMTSLARMDRDTCKGRIQNVVESHTYELTRALRLRVAMPQRSAGRLSYAATDLGVVLRISNLDVHHGPMAKLKNKLGKETLGMG